MTVTQKPERATEVLRDSVPEDKPSPFFTCWTKADPVPDLPSLWPLHCKHVSWGTGALDLAPTMAQTG